jgi:hypothetical protein
MIKVLSNPIVNYLLLISPSLIEILTLPSQLLSRRDRREKILTVIRTFLPKTPAGLVVFKVT